MKRHEFKQTRLPTLAPISLRVTGANGVPRSARRYVGTRNTSYSESPFNGERAAVSGEESARDIAADRLDAGARRGETGTIAGFDRDVDERPPRGRARILTDPQERGRRVGSTETPNESTVT